MRESEIEKYLVDQVRCMGGLALKFVSPGHSGVPDRIIILPGGVVGFLELKAPGERPRKEQSLWIKRLQEKGCPAGWADTRERVDAFLPLLAVQDREGDDRFLQDVLEAGGLL